MNVRAVFEKTQQAGLLVALRNGQLSVKPSAGLSVELRQLLKDHRDDITLAIKNAPSRLVTLAIAAGVCEQGYLFTANEIRQLQDTSDLLDVINCTRCQLQAWASALALRATQARGKVPAGWNKTAMCARCGPVYSFHELDTLSCGWCELRLAGKWFPVPDRVRAEGQSNE